MKKLVFIGLIILSGYLVACTKDETYEVTFVKDEETSFVEEVIEGKTIAEPDVPTRNGYDFEGWYSDSNHNVAYDFSNPVQGDLFIYAKWEAKEYSISLYVDDILVENIEVFAGEDISDLDSIFEEYGGLILYLDADYTTQFNLDIMPSSDFSIYSSIQFSSDAVTITFESNGGSEVDDITAIKGSIIGGIPIPTKEGFEFNGWAYDDDTLFEEYLMPLEDVTLYAKWQEPSISFGIMGPLSKDYSIYGNSVLNGALLAMMEINSSGGILGTNLRIIEADSQGDPTQAVMEFNKLVGDDGIDAFIGGTFSGTTLAIKDLVVANQIPILSPTATNPSVTIDASNVFRTCYTDAYQGKVAATFAYETLSATKAAVLYNSGDAYSTGLADAFIDQFTTVGEVSITQTFSSGDTDFVAQISAIKDANVDVVYLPAYVAQVGAILAEAEDQNLDVVFIGGDGWDSIEIDYADVAEGHYFLNHFAKTDSSSLTQDFITNYTNEFGIEPNALSALAYDSVYAMWSAFEEAGTADYEDVVLALQSLSFSNMITGDFYFDSNGNPVKDISVIQIVNGEHVLTTKISSE